MITFIYSSLIFQLYDTGIFGLFVGGIVYELRNGGEKPFPPTFET